MCEEEEQRHAPEDQQRRAHACSPTRQRSKAASTRRSTPRVNRRKVRLGGYFTRLKNPIDPGRGGSTLPISPSARMTPNSPRNRMPARGGTPERRLAIVEQPSCERHPEDRARQPRDRGIDDKQRTGLARDEEQPHSGWNGTSACAGDGVIHWATNAARGGHADEAQPDAAERARSRGREPHPGRRGPQESGTAPTRPRRAC